ncbi:MAG TPA: DUF4055 domain-containing protein [Pyrinomonadaceae bacterium]|nr:DUF4055 domain-containing protein [Pyrinomonadaceae bacterium]
MKQQEDIVSVRHPDYDAQSQQRVIFKDVCAGTLALRAKGRAYLRKFPAELPESYADRLQASTLHNLTEKTVQVMTGLVFQSEIQLGADVPADITTIAENIDNRGNHLNIFAREVFQKSFQGHSVILVDAPDFTKARSLEDERRLKLRPYWIHYEADQVINWQTRVNPVSKSTELSLIVLKEVTRERAGRFAVGEVTRYRALFLTDAGTVGWELWREIPKAAGLNNKFELVSEGSGEIQKLLQIPVAVIYGKKRGELESSPALLDLALANLRHYNKQSNYDNLLALACIPVPFTKGMESVDADEKLAFGADILMKLSENGDFGWASVDSGAFESLRLDLKDLEDQMATLGLSMLADENASVDVTATEALLNSIGETAELRVMAESLKDALELALGFTAEYMGMGADAGGSIELGTAWENAERIAVDVTAAPLPPAQETEQVDVLVN